MQRNTTISSSIRRYKHENDSIALMDIINRMSPLINKYSRSLYSSEYEDIRQELILALLESVNKIKQYDIEEKCIVDAKNINTNVIEYVGLKCRPCHIHGSSYCYKKHFKCMLDIGVEEVRYHVNDMLSRNQKITG